MQPIALPQIEQEPPIDRSNIEWTGSTWNPWQGCEKVHEGCDHCYMFREMKRYGKRPDVVVRSSDATFRKPLRWQREVERGARRGMDRFVFTCSWSDWFIKDADPWRDEAWEIIRQTPGLIYQILTKRPGRIGANLPAFYDEISDRVIFGTSPANARTMGLVTTLQKQPVKRRFISFEPMLGGVDLRPYLARGGIEAVVFGGESGPDARPCDIAWIRDGIAACGEHAVLVHVKQLGAKPLFACEDCHGRGVDAVCEEPCIHCDGTALRGLDLIDRKGVDPSEWPEDIRVRRWPVEPGPAR